MKNFDSNDFKIDGSEKFSIQNTSTKIKDFYKDKEEYEEILNSQKETLDELQSMMYAHNRYGLLVIFQAMDAAGKDGTVKAVFSGVNPLGLKTYSFKRPSELELNHDFLWRTNLQSPERGSITVFNRSYYEEVLVVKVHPEILTNSQKLPIEETKDLESVWEKRYDDIANMEKYLFNNGIRVVKFFLNISKKEQGERLIERIEDETKNWKFDDQDVKEREFWNDYQNAYQEMINQTSTNQNPWYVIPADDKKNMRLIVAEILIENLKSLNISYPKSVTARQNQLKSLIEIIQKQDTQ